MSGIVPPKKPQTDVERVLEAAKADAGLVREHGGDNRGFEVEAMLKLVGLPPGQPWCAAFVSWIGHYALGSRWPLPLTGSCAWLGEYAAKHGMLLEQPEVGSIFLLWSPAKQRFHHTGFVTAVLRDGVYCTVEGNTNDDGSANGWGVLERQRRFREGDGDRFIAWKGYVK